MRMRMSTQERLSTRRYVRNQEYQFQDGRHLQVGTMYCIGRNYAAHAREMNAELPASPLVFMKSPTAYVAPGQDLHIPSFSQNMQHEVELVVVIGEDSDGVDVLNASHLVAGYAVGLDLTLRDRQAEAKQKGEPWTLSKAFRGSAPLSSVVPAEQIARVEDLEIRLLVNSELRQYGKVSHMERSIEELIVYISGVFGLRRGDCIFTGTPEGVAALTVGDELHASLSNYTDLVCRVRA